MQACAAGFEKALTSSRRQTDSRTRCRSRFFFLDGGVDHYRVEQTRVLVDSGEALPAASAGTVTDTSTRFSRLFIDPGPTRR